MSFEGIVDAIIDIGVTVCSAVCSVVCSIFCRKCHHCCCCKRSQHEHEFLSNTPVGPEPRDLPGHGVLDVG